VVRTIGVAIGIPAPWGPELGRRRAAAGDPMAAFIPAHLTLLGPTEVAEADGEAIAKHLAEVAAVHPPFSLHLKGTGTFRPLNQVVFVAVVADVEACVALAAAVRSGPLDRELRYPYHPHVTVAHDVPTEALDAVSEQLAGFEASFTVPEFTLYEHGGDGHWRPQTSFALAG
jgi:2'-5' RNA ligase